MEREIRTGTIIAIYPRKGYGFIKCQGSEDDLFFHYTAILNRTLDQIRVGDTVNYFEMPGKDYGLQAAHVEVKD